MQDAKERARSLAGRMVNSPSDSELSFGGSLRTHRAHRRRYWSEKVLHWGEGDMGKGGGEEETWAKGVRDEGIGVEV